MSSQKNTGYNLGVYDLRRKNDASKDNSFRESHKDEWLAYYAVCWLDWLEPKDSIKARSLPGADEKMGKKSDCC